MPLLTITNRTPRRLPVSGVVGILNANEVRQVELSSNELELVKAQLVALRNRGQIEWGVDASISEEDNEAEMVFGGAKILRGTGDPNDSVLGEVGDMFVRRDGTPGFTLYVKESGQGTNTGWTPK